MTMPRSELVHITDAVAPLNYTFLADRDPTTVDIKPWEMTAILAS